MFLRVFRLNLFARLHLVFLLEHERRPRPRASFIVLMTFSMMLFVFTCVSFPVWRHFYKSRREDNGCEEKIIFRPIPSAAQTQRAHRAQIIKFCHGDGSGEAASRLQGPFACV
jgi:hypothetical protein